MTAPTDSELRVAVACTHALCLCSHSYQRQCMDAKRHGGATLYCTLPFGHDGSHYNCGKHTWSRTVNPSPSGGEGGKVP